MSTSLLYHGFGATTYDYLKTVYEKGIITFHLRRKKEGRCSECRSWNLVLQGERQYRVKAPPIGMKPVDLVLYLSRVKCRNCGKKKQEPRDICRPRKSYTKQVERMVLSLQSMMTVKDIATIMRLAWHQVKEILKRDLEKKEKRRSWSSVKWIAIDEFAVGKGHKYMTVVVDLESGEVLDVVDGKGSEALKPVFVRLRRARAPLEAVAVDMSSAFRKAIKEYAPEGVKIIHDPFHLVMMMNKAVDQVRRAEQKCLDKQDKDYIKGNRYLLLRGAEKLDSDKDRLDEMLKMNDNISKAYILKEDFRQIWSQKTKAEAKSFLRQWIKSARRMKLAPMKRLAKTIEDKMGDILSWYDVPITTGPLEGLNNKIKTLKRRAYGYRDMEFFRLLILFLHPTRFKLQGGA